MSNHDNKLTSIIAHLERITGENVREEYCFDEDAIQTALDVKRDLCVYMNSLYETYQLGDDIPIFVLASMLSDRLHTSSGVGINKIADSILAYEDPQSEFNELFLERTNTPIASRVGEYEQMLYGLASYIFEDLKQRSGHIGGKPESIGIYTLDLSAGRVIDDVIIEIDSGEDDS